MIPIEVHASCCGRAQRLKSRLRSLLHKTDPVVLLYSMLIRTTHCSADCAFDLRDLVVANFFFYLSLSETIKPSSKKSISQHSDCYAMQINHPIWPFGPNWYNRRESSLCYRCKEKRKKDEFKRENKTLKFDLYSRRRQLNSASVWRPRAQNLFKSFGGWPVWVVILYYKLLFLSSVQWNTQGMDGESAQKSLKSFHVRFQQEKMKVVKAQTEAFGWCMWKEERVTMKRV